MMKTNNKEMEKSLGYKNGFLVTCVCSIVLLLTLCYFGINTNFKGTSAASSSYTCSDSTDVVIQSSGGYFCCPKAYGTNATIKLYNGTNYCVPGDTSFGQLLVSGTADPACESSIERTFSSTDELTTTYNAWRSNNNYLTNITQFWVDNPSMVTKLESLFNSQFDGKNWTIQRIPNSDFNGDDQPDHAISLDDMTNDGSVIVEAWAESSLGDGCFAVAEGAIGSDEYGCYKTATGYSWVTAGNAFSSWTLEPKYTTQTECEAANDAAVEASKVCYYCSTKVSGKHYLWAVDGDTYLESEVGCTKVSGVTSEQSCDAKNGTVSYTITYVTISQNTSADMPTTATLNPSTTSVSVTAGNSITLPTASASGYTFDGWYTAVVNGVKRGGAGASYTPQKTETLYAQWTKTGSSSGVATGDVATGEDEPAKYTIKYDANGGSGAPASQTKTEDVKLTLSSTKPTRSGYTFKNWNTASNGSGTTYTAGATYSANASATLYAQWTYNGSSSGGTTDPTPTTYTYTATFNPNGGTLNGSSTKSCTTTTSGSSCSINSLPTATKSGYTFKGWGTSTSCTSGSTSSLTLNAHTTYYACYTKNSTSSGNNNGNVNDNPKTGELAIALVWAIGLFAIGYSVWYFKKAKQN